jgi:hypothetical protein
MDPRQQQNGNNRGILAPDESQQKAASQQAAAPVVREKRFRVVETIQVSRGASHYVLPQGKTISSLGYDIAKLRSHGVKLEEVTAP